MKLLITICGRSGSKGVRSKNIRDFLGRPLIHYTLISALQYKQKKQFEMLVDICVSSDSMELLEIAKKYEGVFTIVRPNELSTELAPKVPVIQHATKTMEETLGREYDIVMDLDITSPLRKFEDMENALNKLLDKSYNYDLVFSAVKARRNPYFNMVEINEGIAFKVKQSNYV
ncbi:MAG: acylneuraminate cytidylyltransferase family protein, partial [Clostridia bacterium]|nr:acylneuraminate cytidylyltransferase family protein [Clostridia bacterium]